LFAVPFAENKICKRICKRFLNGFRGNRMKYKGKSIEVIGSKMLFGKETLWIHILADVSFAQVLRSDL
jgi:hypothetical protein